MIAADEDALICDLAETYNILNYRALPVSLLATLCVGLRDNSRIKMKLCDTSVSQETLLLAACVDRLSFLVWTKTTDAQKDYNRPKSVLEAITGKLNNDAVCTFETAEEFEAERRKIIGGE